MVCENIFTAPSRSNGWKWWFQSLNRLDCNFWKDSKSRRTSKSHYWFKLRQFCWKKWIFPIGQIGEASWWRVCYQRGLPSLVSFKMQLILIILLCLQSGNRYYGIYCLVLRNLSLCDALSRNIGCCADLKGGKFIPPKLQIVFFPAHKHSYYWIV